MLSTLQYPQWTLAVLPFWVCLWRHGPAGVCGVYTSTGDHKLKMTKNDKAKLRMYELIAFFVLWEIFANKIMSSIRRKETNCIHITMGMGKIGERNSNCGARYARVIDYLQELFFFHGKDKLVLRGRMTSTLFNVEKLIVFLRFRLALCMISCSRCCCCCTAKTFSCSTELSVSPSSDTAESTTLTTPPSCSSWATRVFGVDAELLSLTTVSCSTCASETSEDRDDDEGSEGGGGCLRVSR